MRRASLAPNPAGGDGGGAAHGVSRLQMPQVMTMTTRPPLHAAAGPSDHTTNRTTSPMAVDAAEADVSSDDAVGGDDDEPMVPVMKHARLPVSPAAASAATRKEGSVQVAVRVRPLLPKEIATRVRTCVESEGNSIYIPSNDKTFTFDHVFPMEAGQKDLYEQVVQPLMDSFVQGYNVTVLAYGQTGSGKTYTMGNDSSTAALAPRLLQRGQPEYCESDDPAASGMDDHEGVIPRFINEMFERLEVDKESTNSQVSVSFLEIYGEEIHDLLGQPRDSLQVRESNGSVWVQGLTEINVSSFAEAAEQMRQGCLRRITGSTGMNEHSSRSHAVYTVKLVRKTKKTLSSIPTTSAENAFTPPTKRRGSRRFSSSHASHGLLGDDDSETIIVSKLTFVDLAGSERLKKTQAEGDRMKEGIQINVGLLALGNVITALGDERRRSNPRQHVAYRDSKLTRLLQDALGGNSRTLFIACISPAESNAGETVNTLQYASRAKNIQNKAVKNVDPRSAELTRAKVLNDVLRNALAKTLSVVSGEPENVDQLLGDRTVADILRKLEDIAWSIASGSTSSSEATLEMSRAIAALVARRGSSPMSTSSPVFSEDFLSTRRADTTSSDGSRISLIDGSTSDTGSSIHLDHGFGHPSTCTSLRQVSRVLEVIGLTLEIQELKDHLLKTHTSIEAEGARLDMQVMRTHALIEANESVLSKMETWNANSELTSQIDRAGSYGQAAERLQVLKREAESLARNKALQANTLAENSSEIRRQLEEKEGMLQKVRQSDETFSAIETSSPLDLMLQITELKDRFRLHELCDVAWALGDDEKACCEMLDDHPDALAFKPKFFPDEDSGLSQTFLSDIYKSIDTAIAAEDLHTSQCKRLRERAAIMQRIIDGWARDTRSMTEEEFLAGNEEELRICEENIKEISAALRYRTQPSSTIAFKIDAIDSLDLAKGLIKRLVDALYGHKRIGLARAQSEITSGEHGPPNEVSSRVSNMKKQFDRDLDAVRDQFAKDLEAAYEMVKPFALEALNLESESLYAQRQSDLKTIAHLKEQTRLNDVEMQRMQHDMEGLHNQVESMKSQFEQLKEYASLREECAQLAKELGLPSEDFAGIAAMINPLAIKEAQDIRETLLAKKAEKLERIEIEYNRVKSLEAILKTQEPLNIEVIRSNHERILDDQLLAINYHHKKLVEELSQRIDSQIRVLDSISGLSAEIEVTCIEDLRHVNDYLSSQELQSAIQMLPDRESWKIIRASSDLAIAISDLMPQNASLGEALSGEALERNGRVLKALLLEKANRLAEVEKTAAEVRSLIEQMELPEGEVISTLLHAEGQRMDDEPRLASAIAEELQSILRKAGQLDTSRRALNRLTAIRDELVEVRDGRSNALSYLYSVLDEAEKVAQESLASSGIQDFFAAPLSDCNPAEMREFGYSRESLRIGVDKLKALSDPADRAIRALLFASNDQFNAYGIETSAQRISFFLGSEDTVDNPNRKLLERYLGDSSEQDVTTRLTGTVSEIANCLLTENDPAYSDFAIYFSPSYGSKRVEELKHSASDIRQISGIVISAQRRLKSLQKIMTDFNSVMAMKKEIAEFAANASKKDRLFGSSTVLLKEEKKRKRFARDYPLKLAGLRGEVQKWVENESGEFDLDILGEEMKRLLLDMLNTDTNLMHLDLGVLDPSRPSARRASKTAAGISMATAALAQGAQPVHPNQEPPAAGAPRVRPSSALVRDGSGKKRGGAD